MKIIVIIISILITFNTNTFSQIYDFVNSQLFLKSSYEPSEFYLEKCDTIPHGWKYSRELALPNSQKASILVFDESFDTVKVIHNGSLKRGLYDIRWNLTNKQGIDIEDGLYSIEVKTDTNSDTSKILVFGRNYYKPMELSKVYLSEFEKNIYDYLYIGNGQIQKGSIENLKNYEIIFDEVKLDTASNSSIEIRGYVRSIESFRGNIPYFDIVVTSDWINFNDKGQLDIHKGALTSNSGFFYFKTIVFPNTKIYFLHKDYVIKYFHLGKLSSIYKNDPEMLKRYLDKDKATKSG